MSVYHCACGFAINDAAEFADHLLEVFDRVTGTDGRPHAELITGDDRDSRVVCACGFRADTGTELDDHLLLALIPPDAIGVDGQKHVPLDPSTPVGRWFVT